MFKTTLLKTTKFKVLKIDLIHYEIIDIMIIKSYKELKSNYNWHMGFSWWGCWNWNL